MAYIKCTVFFRVSDLNTNKHLIFLNSLHSPSSPDKEKALVKQTIVMFKNSKDTKIRETKKPTFWMYSSIERAT